MRISDRRNRRLLTILALELVFLTMIGLSFDNASRPAISGPGPYTVLGYVTDSEGTPVEGADVAVTIEQTATTLHCVTDSDGYYIAEFDLSEWNDGDDITVVATYGGQATSTGTCVEAVGYSVIDVQFTYEIPEFGGIAGSMVAIAAVAVVAALFIWKRPR